MHVNDVVAARRVIAQIHTARAEALAEGWTPDVAGQLQGTAGEDFDLDHALECAERNLGRALTEDEAVSFLSQMKKRAAGTNPSDVDRFVRHNTGGALHDIGLR